MPAICRAWELRPSPATMNLAVDPAARGEPRPRAGKIQLEKVDQVLDQGDGGIFARRRRQFRDESVVLDILAEGVEVDLARAEFLRAGGEDRAGVVDHPDALHRGGMFGEARPQPERAVEAQRTLEQSDGAAGEMGLDLADHDDLAALRREGVGGRKPRRTRTRDQHVAFDGSFLFLLRWIFFDLSRDCFSLELMAQSSSLPGSFYGPANGRASGLWRQVEMSHPGAISAPVQSPRAAMGILGGLPRRLSR